MKKINNFLSIVFFGALLLMQVACDGTNDPIVPETNLDLVEDEFVINAAYEDLDFLTLDVLQSSGLGLRTQALADLCANTIVTRDEGAKKITVDFGAGCTSPNGITRKGKVILVYSGTSFLFPGSSIITTFDGYEVNGLQVKGTRTITNAGIDLINSRVTLNVKIENGIITWPDNTSVTYSSTQVRQVKLGSAGYEASVTGTASGISRKGFEYTAVVTTPLIIKEDCARTGVYVPSSGVLSFNFLGITASVDYGTGTCDKVVVVSYPGGTKEITLD